MTDLDAFVGTVTDRYVWCTCGWIAGHDLEPVAAAYLWDEHCEHAHTRWLDDLETAQNGDQQ